MSPFHAPEGPFTIESVMESIHDQTNGAPPEAHGEALPPPAAPTVTDGGSRSRLLININQLAAQLNEEAAFRIRSHRKYLGWLPRIAKRLMHWGSRPYVDYNLQRQMAFNESTLQLMRDVLQYFDTRTGEIERMTARLEQRLDRIEKFRHNANDPYDLTAFFHEAPFDKRMQSIDRSRGAFDDIRERQASYLDLLRDLPGPVLDVGCGRGEMLDLLAEHEIEAWGAEPDPTMAWLVNHRGLKVRQTDMYTAMRETEGGALGGIFAAQVVEHLFPAELLEFLRLARTKLAPGGRIVLETLNPASLGVLAKSYFRDLDHKQPIHPETMRDLLVLAGFEDVEMVLISPCRDDEKTPAMPPAETCGLSEEARDAIQSRIEAIDELLHGAQDYYVTGLCPAAPQETPA